MKLINDGKHQQPVPRNEFYICPGDIILRGDQHYRVDRIETVQEGPDAGKRDVLTVTPAVSSIKAVRVWTPA